MPDVIIEDVIGDVLDDIRDAFNATGNHVDTLNRIINVDGDIIIRGAGRVVFEGGWAVSCNRLSIEEGTYKGHVRRQLPSAIEQDSAYRDIPKYTKVPVTQYLPLEPEESLDLDIRVDATEHMGTSAGSTETLFYRVEC